VTYAGSAGDNLIQPVDINAPLAGRRDGRERGREPGPPLRGVHHDQLPTDDAKARYTACSSASATTPAAPVCSRSRTPEPDQDRRHQRPRRDRPAAGPHQPRRRVRDRNAPTARTSSRPTTSMSCRSSRTRKASRRRCLGGWQVSGITQFWSGPPISRVVNGQTNGSRRGIRVNQVGDPFSSLLRGHARWRLLVQPFGVRAAGRRPVPHHRPLDLRLPGVNQWDITLSKNFYPRRGHGPCKFRPTSSTRSTTRSSIRLRSRTPARSRSPRPTARRRPRNFGSSPDPGAARDPARHQAVLELAASLT